jgi:hypothetical protein
VRHCPAILICLALAVMGEPGLTEEPAGGAAGLRRSGQDRSPAPTPPYERVTFRAHTGRRPVDGSIVVEAADGGLLLEAEDGRYLSAAPTDISFRQPIAGPGELTPRDLGLRVLADLPPGFSVHITKHYVFCHDTSADYARWAAGLFERLHTAFENFWRRAGLELQAAEKPLVVVIFSNRRDYETYATGDLGAAADRISGYYNLLSNRVVTYDLTGSDALRQPGRTGRVGTDVLARPEAAGLVSTLVHEATHQLAFNRGMHRRMAPVPVWVSEGIATVFETPDLRSTDGWRGIGTINRVRLDRFRRGFQPGDLENIIVADDRFRDPDTALDAYAAGWALAWFLLETRRDQFVHYLQTLAAKPPLGRDSPDRRRADFAAAFGMTPAELEQPLLRHMARLELRRP